MRENIGGTPLCKQYQFSPFFTYYLFFLLYHLFIIKHSVQRSLTCLTNSQQFPSAIVVPIISTELVFCILTAPTIHLGIFYRSVVQKPVVCNYFVASRTLNESVQILEFISSWLPCILEGCLSPADPCCQTLASFQKSLRALPQFCSYKEDLHGKGRNGMSRCGCPPCAPSPQPSCSHSSESVFPTPALPPVHHDILGDSPTAALVVQFDALVFLKMPSLAIIKG